jgi:hypothetical protein
MNRSTIIQLFLLLVLIACLAACDEKRSSRENMSTFPKQDPDSEYPGTKEHDSLKQTKPDQTLEAKENQAHP